MARIGGMRKRCYFSKPAKRVEDGGGGSPKAWLNALTVWGELIPQTGQERVAAGRLEASGIATLRIRSSSDARTIDESYKVTVDDVDYQIRGIDNPDQRNRFLEMLVEVGVAL